MNETDDSRVLESLPNQPLSGEIVNSLAEHDMFEQVVAVRGYYTNDSPVVIQLLLNLPNRGLIAVDYTGDRWQIVWDSAKDFEAPEDLSDDEASRRAYQKAHERLTKLAPNMEAEYGSYFENSLSEESKMGEDQSYTPAETPDGLVTADDLEE